MSARAAVGILVAFALVCGAAACGRKARPEPKWGGGRPALSASQHGSR